MFEPAIISAIKDVLNKKALKSSFFLLGSDGNATDLKKTVVPKKQIYKAPLSSYLDDQKPIMIWTTIDYGEVTSFYEWHSYDGIKTYTYPRNSHAVVVTGYDDKYYYINDPLKDTPNIPVEKEKLEKSFDSLGRQTIKVILYNEYFGREPF